MQTDTTQTSTTAAPPPPGDGQAAGGATPQTPPAGTTPAASTAGSTPTAGDTGGASGATGAQGTAGQSTQASDFTLKLPEGVKAEDGLFKAFVPLAKELGLKGEQAQKLVDLVVSQGTEAQKAAQAAQEASRTQQFEKWAEAAKADKEYGGADFDANLKTAQRALERFGGKGLVEVLESTGLGNHPDVLRAFYRAGKAIAEDSVGGAHGGSGKGGEMSEAERLALLFPSMAQPKP